MKLLRLVYQNHTVLDDGRVLMRVAEHWAKRLLGFPIGKVVLERTYSFVPGVGFWFDGQHVEVRRSDPRALWLGRVWMANRTSEKVDRLVGLAH